MSIRRNFVYSCILTVANYIFPLLTYPYVSRVLGVTNVGICNFVDSIINFFILFSMMGITTLGIREIAGTAADKDKRGRVFSSLFILNAIATLIMFVLLCICIYLVPQFKEYKELMYVGAAKLLANLFLVEWFFKGTENFRYITNRTILVKCLYVISVFLFVREAEDYPIYFLLIALMTIVNASINFPYACTKVKFSFKGIQLKPLVKPFIVMGCYALLTSMYTSFNVTYLGFVSTPEHVGYYTTATKLFHITLAIYTAFTGVMMPRMSALYAEGKIEAFKSLINKSIDLLFSFSVPLILFMLFFVPEIIWLLSGEGYEGAFLPARIIMPLILIIGYEQILVMQILMPARKDGAVLSNSILGAVVGVAANLLIVDQCQSVGSSVVWLLSEISVLLSAQYFVSKEINIGFPIKALLLNIVYYAPSFFIIFLFRIIINSDFHMYVMMISLFVLLLNAIIVVRYTQTQILMKLLYMYNNRKGKKNF